MPKRTQTRLTKNAVAATVYNVWDSEVPGFGVRVLPSGLKTFVFQFRTLASDQGRITIGRFPALTVDEARKQAREFRNVVDRGGNPSRDRHEARHAPTMRDLADLYCNEYGPEKGLKAQTIKDARRMLDQYVLTGWGNRKVIDISTSDVRKMHSSARDGSGPYAANRLRAFLSKMFSLAIGEEWRSTNPCKGVDRYNEDQRWNYLSPGQVSALLDACDRYEDQGAANAVRMLLFSGARLREVLHATWDQVDLERGVWVKPSHHTKTKIRHQVHLADALVSLLQEMRDQDPTGTFLFPGRSDTAPRSDLKRPWTALLKEAGLPAFVLHDLRRTTASFMLSGGCSLAEVGKVLGHTQASTTARYAQLFESAQRDGINRATRTMTGGVTAIAA